LAVQPQAEVEQREPLIPKIRVTRQERNRLILVGLAAVVILWLLVNSWDGLGPFIIALVLGYLMLPLVDLIARFVPRAIAILLVYLVFIGAVWALVSWLFPLIGSQVKELSDDVPAYQKQFDQWSAQATDWYNNLPISAEVRHSIDADDPRRERP